MVKRSALLFLLAMPTACIDKVHDDAVDALGGETPGVRPGPLHRPGQPCVTCHGSEGPANPEFSLAGTVHVYSHQYVDANPGSEMPAVGVTVLIEDINGVAGTVTTNEVGSFWVDAKAWRPTYPLKVELLYGSVTQEMQTTIGRAGSCADCHTAEAGQRSPGWIYLAINPTALQKAMQPQ